jgi:3-oxoacyl-[acyl-carrier-protein] synthase-1
MIRPLVLTHFTTVNACGHGLAATLDALRAGRSGLRRCDFEDAGLDTFIGRVEGIEDAPVRADLADFDCRNNRLAQIALRLDGFEAAVAAAAARHGPERVAVVMGSSTSGVGEGEIAYRGRRDPDQPLPESFKFSQTHDFYSLGRFVHGYLGLAGPSTTVSAACASSSKVFADAWQWLEADLCDAVVVGGVDSLCLMTLRGFNSLELLSHGPCRPNDAARSGISIGEAAGFALVERMPAKPPPGAIGLYGYGESNDAHHMSSPHPDGKGAILAMQGALERAGLKPEEIDYINLHGTGSGANDRIEDKAVYGIFGDRVPTSSTKGWTGHALGAAGITEAVICCLALRAGLIPANLNLQTLDPDFRSAVQAESSARPIRRVVSNSFGFGGNNCSIVLGSAE